MIVAPILIFGFLFIVPLIDRPQPGKPRSRVVVILALLVLAFYVGGIVYGVFAPQKAHLGMNM